MTTAPLRIRINSSEANKDSGFYALLTSGLSVICLKDEEYVVTEQAIDRLNEKGVKYELVTKKQEKEGVAKNNAAEA